MTSVRTQLLGVDDAVQALESRLDAELEAAARVGGQVVAAIAQQTHAWQNRTGDTEALTGDIPPTGRFSDGTLVFGAMSGTAYSSYLEARFPYLEPAFQMAEGRLEYEFDAALRRAAADTPGWRAG
jgi:hypothetical protein